MVLLLAILPSAILKILKLNTNGVAGWYVAKGVALWLV